MTLMGGLLGLPTRRTAPRLWEVPEGAGRHHVPQDPNPKAMNGGRGGLAPLRPRSQAGGGGTYVVQNGIYVPLAGINPRDPLEGGYGFGDWTDFDAYGNPHTRHPGVDLNAGPSCNSDDGAPLVAPCDAEVVAVIPWDGASAGEGNHLWLFLSDGRCWAPAWMHFDHCRTIDVREGEHVLAGQRIAATGRTGGWACAHSHEELAKQQPPSWWMWPYGWSLAQVEATYYDPYTWFANTVAKAGSMAGGDGWTEVPMSVTPEELEAMRPYFATYGVDPNMGTAIMQRAGLAYKRDESPGPCLTDEYPYGDYVRQDFTARVGEYHPDDGLVYWVEVVKEAKGA